MRGQIWYVNKGKKYMEHSGGKRPAIVVSEENLNNKTNRVMVVYLTTHEYEHEEKVPVMVKGNQSYAVCDNINTVFKDELSGYAGTVDDETMKKIEEQMEKSLGLAKRGPEKCSSGQRHYCYSTISAEYSEEIEHLKEVVVKGLQNEAAFYKRAYEDLLAKVIAR